MKRILFLAIFICLSINSFGQVQTMLNPEWDMLFRPLVADPKWPRYGATLNYHPDPNENRTNRSAGLVLGQSIAILSGGFGNSGVLWDAGLQASVQNRFDTGTDSYDMVNSDFIFGIPFSVKWNRLTAMFRVYHQSSHLGDEFLIAHGTQRENMSYEALSLLLSYDVNNFWRIYGGVEYGLEKPKPSDYGKFYYQLGTELYVNTDYLPDLIFALDLKGIEGWKSYTPAVSFKINVHLARSFYFVLQAYHGFSHDGQFFRDTDTYFGFGFELY